MWFKLLIVILQIICQLIKKRDLTQAEQTARFAKAVGSSDLDTTAQMLADLLARDDSNCIDNAKPNRAHANHQCGRLLKRQLSARKPENTSDKKSPDSK